MTTSVVGLHIALASRLPMRAVDQVDAEAGTGLVGDRYHGTKHRHVSIQSAVALAEAAEILGEPIEPGATRRNVTLSDGEIPTKPGTRITIAGVELEVVRIAAPCSLLDDVIGSGARKALHGRAGTIFRLLSSGTIALGDAAAL